MLPRSVPPLANPNFHHVVSSPLLTAEQCDRLTGALDPSGWTVSTYLNSGDELGLAAHQGLGATGKLARSDGQARSSMEQGLPLFGAWPVNLIAEAIAIANMSHFRFELTSLPDFDPPTVLRYSHENRGHFERHVDIVAPLSTRKLSYVVQLSDPDDYGGGDLLFPDLSGHASSERGSITVFPSFVAHEVRPVTRGERLAIVGWVHGPAFR